MQSSMLSIVLYALLGFSCLCQSTIVPPVHDPSPISSPAHSHTLAKRHSDEKLQIDAKCHTDEAMNEPIFGNLRFKYTIALKNFENTGYCGKGLLDNLHTHCQGEWPQNWDCKQSAPDEQTASFEMPKVNKYRCIEDAIHDASDGRVTLTCEGVNAVASAIGTGVSIGSMAIPGAGGVAGRVGGMVGKEVATSVIKDKTQGDQKGGAAPAHKGGNTIRKAGAKAARRRKRHLLLQEIMRRSL